MRLTRDRILDEALELILTNGLRRASATELARRLVVVKSGLYHHFPGGKSEIFDAVFEREETALIAAMVLACAGETVLQKLVPSVVPRSRGSPTSPVECRCGKTRPMTSRATSSPEADSSVSSGSYSVACSRKACPPAKIRPIPGDLVVAALQGALARVSKAFAINAGKRRLALVDDLVEVLFRGIGASAPAVGEYGSRRNRAQAPRLALCSGGFRRSWPAPRRSHPKENAGPVLKSVASSAEYGPEEGLDRSR